MLVITFSAAVQWWYCMHVLIYGQIVIVLLDKFMHAEKKRNKYLCALGILLFAKAHADQEGIFTFSQSDFANWVGIQQPHVSTCFDELELFDYIIKKKYRGAL